MKVPWHLRGLPAPGLACDDYNTVMFECIKQLLPMGSDREALLLLPNGQVSVLVVHMRLNQGRAPRTCASTSVERGLGRRIGPARFPKSCPHGGEPPSQASLPSIFDAEGAATLACIKRLRGIQYCTVQ